jgi:hypothetical protein
MRTPLPHEVHPVHHPVHGDDFVQVGTPTDEVETPLDFLQEPVVRQFATAFAPAPQRRTNCFGSVPRWRRTWLGGSREASPRNSAAAVLRPQEFPSGVGRGSSGG